MLLRFAPVLTAAVVLVAAVACAGTTVSPGSPSPLTAPMVAPTPTPVPAPTRIPDPISTPPPNTGDVGGQPGAELSVELSGSDRLDVTLEDAEAEAWRVVVAGTGAMVDDRLEVVVEAGDVGLVITATEIQRGELVDTIDLSNYVDDTAAAGGCHRTLNVCIDSSSFRFSDDGTGRLRIRLQMAKPSAGPMVVTGGTAGWPGEPFILGPWTDTAPFTWGGS